MRKLTNWNKFLIFLNSTNDKKFKIILFVLNCAIVGDWSLVREKIGLGRRDRKPSIFWKIVVIILVFLKWQGSDKTQPHFQ